MSEFRPSYLEIDEQELVNFLLNAAGQTTRDSVNPKDLLDYLKLDYIQVDFERELSGIERGAILQPPRALISFNDKLIATEKSLDTVRMRFSVLHEIGHYVLPKHQNSLYICDRRAMGFNTQMVFEQEANQFAANHLFLAGRFDLEANSNPISPATVKKLGGQFEASFEATARRIANKTYRDCMFVSFAKDTSAAINSDAAVQWRLRYCIPSPSFSHKYFSSLRAAIVPPEIARRVCAFQDIAQSAKEEIEISVPSFEKPQSFVAEYFYNTFNIFCFITPTSSA